MLLKFNMASYSRIKYVSIVYILFYFIYGNFVTALFEDQVGKFDWKKEFIGQPEYFHILPENRKIIVTTKNNVLAMLNPHNGETGWRQIHEIDASGRINLLLGHHGEVFTLSNDGSIIRSWDITSGFLKTEVPVDDSDTPNVVASYYQLLLDDDQLVKAEITSDSFLQILIHNTSSGHLVNGFKIPTTWSHGNISCHFVSQLLFACIDHVSNYLHVLKVKEDENFIITPLTLFISRRSRFTEILPIHGLALKAHNNFILRVSKGHYKVLAVEEDSVKEIINLPETHCIDVLETSDGLVLFSLQPIKEAAKHSQNSFRFSAVNLITGETIPSSISDIQLPSHHGQPEKIWMFTVPKKEGGTAYRALLVSEDHAITYVHNSGKLLWTREEALASVVNVEIVDLPLSESDAHFEQEFRSGDANILSMLIKRITTQLYQLDTFCTSILNELQVKDRSGENPENTLQLTRDEFNLHKLIILVTKPGKVFGVDSLTGSIIWRHFVANIEPFDSRDGEKLMLFIQRTTAFFPHPPQCIIVGRNKFTGKGLLHPFDPISGTPLSDTHITLDYEIAQAILLPQSDKEYLRPLLLLDKEKKAHVYPVTGIEVAKHLSKSLFIFTVDVDVGTMNGFSLAYSTEKELIATPVWEIYLSPSTQNIIHVVGKRPTEHVHSQGRVMGDRSVMYKYLNPNLVSIFTLGKDNQLKYFFNIFILDVVTGSIVYSAHHKRCREPLHIVHSENWIVYTYYSEKSRRTEMAVLELYEGKSQSNSTAFSSLNPPPIPTVESQAYIFPPGLTSAAVTITEKGITSKFLLFALPSGKILELPKAFLDPRRSLIPTQEHREEGIYPYTPELPIPSENIINYNQSIHHIRGIYTAPAGLESTCLVLAYGLDLFYTRITPSRTFDVLKDDFDHYLISAVLLALVAASYITRKLAARKALHQAWK